METFLRWSSVVLMATHTCDAWDEMGEEETQIRMGLMFVIMGDMMPVCDKSLRRSMEIKKSIGSCEKLSCSEVLVENMKDLNSWLSRNKITIGLINACSDEFSQLLEVITGTKTIPWNINDGRLQIPDILDSLELGESHRRTKNQGLRTGNQSPQQNAFIFLNLCNRTSELTCSELLKKILPLVKANDTIVAVSSCYPSTYSLTIYMKGKYAEDLLGVDYLCEFPSHVKRLFGYGDAAKSSASKSREEIFLSPWTRNVIRFINNLFWNANDDATAEKQLNDDSWLKFREIRDIHCFGFMDIVVFGGGCHIVFFDLHTRQKNVFRPNCDTRGDGIKCVACHWELPVFAFAEKCVKPRILVHIYPSFQLVTVIETNVVSGYLQIAFLESELLVSLDSYPDFAIKVWNWRNGELLISCQSGVPSIHQCLRCSSCKPNYACQVPYHTELVYIWEIQRCYNKYFLEKHEVWLPRECSLADFSWTPNGTLLLVDENATVYSVDFNCWDLFEEYRWLGEMKYQPRIASYAKGFVLATPEGGLIYFSGGTEWIARWSISPRSPLTCMLVSVVTNVFYGIDEMGYLCTLSDERPPSVEHVDHFQGNVVHFDIIQPPGDFMATVSPEDYLFLWDMTTGHKVGTYVCSKKVLCMESNPVEPYLALGRNDGVVDFINCVKPSAPELMCQLYMSEYELTDMRFTTSGLHLFAVSAKHGHMFVVQCMPGNRMIIRSNEQVAERVIDIAATEDDPFVIMFVLVQTRHCCPCGNQLHIYTSIFNTSRILLQNVILTDTHYTNILTTGISPYMLCCAPHRSRSIHVMFMQKPAVTKQKYNVAAVSMYDSGHEFRNFRMNFSHNFVITYGRDGLMFVRKLPNFKEEALVICHHRIDLGIRKALLDPLTQTVVSLGYDGMLVCTSVRNIPSVEKKVDFRHIVTLPEMSCMMETKPTRGFVPTEDEPPDWISYQEEMKRLQLKGSYETKRQTVLEKFLAVNRKMEELIAENAMSPTEEQLSVSTFEVNLKYRDKLLQDFEDSMEKRKEDLESSIDAYNALRDQILHKTWDVMDVKIDFVQSIFGYQKVASYHFPPLKEEYEQKKNKWISFKKLMLILNEESQFHPWIVYLQRKVQPSTPNEFLVKYASIVKEVIVNADKYQRNQEGSTTFSGSYTYKYIEPPATLLSQFEIGTYNQIVQEIYMYQTITENLRHFFNNVFKKAKTQKEFDMKIAIERGARLRHLLNELNDEHTIVNDPEWGKWENMDTMLTIQPYEVKSPPYITPSEQSLLDRLAAEEEARRLAEAPDPFRLQALDVMMDGVLELRWEDRIKKDIPLPKCMIEKQPEEFDEDDLRAVKEYEAKVVVLMAERERYRLMCEAEYSQLRNEIIEGVNKFEKYLKEICFLKAEIETCIQQENLKIYRLILNCHDRIILEVQEKELKVLIIKHEQVIKDKDEKLAVLGIILNECKNDYSKLAERDTEMDANFKTSFPRLPSYVVETLYKFFKRRPKMSTKLQSSASLLREVLATMKIKGSPRFMTTECKDYLRGFHHLEHQRGPPNVDAGNWQSVCDQRRKKIISEIEIKAATILLRETQSTFDIQALRLEQEKERHKDMLEELQKIQQEIVDAVVDVQFQMLVQQRIVEILDENASVYDFRDGVLIHRRQVERLNQQILERGKVKIGELERVVKFHNVILGVEWEHKRLRMTIDDLQEQLHTINRLTLTKELQVFLRLRTAGLPDNHGILTPEQQVMQVKQDFEKRFTKVDGVLKEISEKCEEYRRKNRSIERKVQSMIADISEMVYSIDFDSIKEEKKNRDKTLKLISKKGFLLLDIEMNQEELMLLQTKLELLRQKVYPSLGFKEYF